MTLTALASVTAQYVGFVSGGDRYLATRLLKAVSITTASYLKEDLELQAEEQDTK